MNRKNVILTGFMGSGKTTVGKLLAAQLGYRFVDTDQLIEQRCGMTIDELFKVKGEAVFRSMETAIARELAAGQDMVISTGGRLMLDPENATALLASGQAFCLVATAEDILKRIAADKGAKRPLLDTPDPMNRIVLLLQERHTGYSRFCQIVTTGKSAQQVATEILGIFKANQK